MTIAEIERRADEVCEFDKPKTETPWNWDKYDRKVDNRRAYFKQGVAFIATELARCVSRENKEAWGIIEAAIDWSGK